MLKRKKKIVKIILCALNLPALILMILIYPVLRIKITELETRSIGHFSTSVEIFLSELKRNIHGKKKIFYIWYTNNHIANNFLLKKWKEKIIVGPRIILEPLFYIIHKYSFLKFLRTPFRHWEQYDNIPQKWQANDIYNVLPKTKPNINFNFDEQKYCNNFLKKQDTKINNYVCFFSRSKHYYKDDVQLRDSDIEDQIQGIQKLCKENHLKAIRIGSTGLKLKKYNSTVFDYANSKYKQEMLDIFLPMNCKFMIGTSSGMNCIPVLNRKKTLLISRSDMHSIGRGTETYAPLMIPKKFKKLSNNKLLSFSEVFELKLTEFRYKKDLNKFGYQSVSNSSVEVSDAIFEMDKLINQNKVKIEDTKLQRQFWEILYKFYRIKKPRVLRICNSFLKRNEKLIK